MAAKAKCLCVDGLFLADATTRFVDRELDAAELLRAPKVIASCSDMWRRVTHATSMAQVD